MFDFDGLSIKTATNTPHNRQYTDTQTHVLAI